MAYNELHNIVPQTVVKEKRQTISEIIGAAPRKKKHKMPDLHCNAFTDNDDAVIDFDKLALNETQAAELVAELTREMLSAAEALEFERAADLRDRIRMISGKKRSV